MKVYDRESGKRFDLTKLEEVRKGHERWSVTLDKQAIGVLVKAKVEYCTGRITRSSSTFTSRRVTSWAIEDRQYGWLTSRKSALSIMASHAGKGGTDA